MSYDELKHVIGNDAQLRTGRGATSDEIGAAQGGLSVVFPRDYGRFLSDFGWLEGYAERVFGLGGDVPRHQDLVRETLAERHEFRPYLPVDLIPLRNDGAGNIYALDLRQQSDDPPVVLWDHEFGEDQEPEFEASSFVAWMKDLLDFVKDR